MGSKIKNLIIILGPTATGKSQISIQIAKSFNGEIINCDSIQVYKGFDIGTDKLSPEKWEGIPHHLLDFVDPTTQFNAAKFIKLASKTAEVILEKGKLPIVTGGTGLYLKALVEGLFPEEKKNRSLREELDAEWTDRGSESMWEELKTIDPEYAQNTGKHDKIRIVRALEVFRTTGIPFSKHFPETQSLVSDFYILKIGLKLERDILNQRIENRVDMMFSKGIIDEVRMLLASGVSSSSPPFRALGYKYVLQFLQNKKSLHEAIFLTKRDTRRYAKRQMTWFRKMKDIHWFSPGDLNCIEELIKKKLKTY